MLSCEVESMTNMAVASNFALHHCRVQSTRFLDVPFNGCVPVLESPVLRLRGDYECSSVRWSTVHESLRPGLRGPYFDFFLHILGIVICARKWHGTVDKKLSNG